MRTVGAFLLELLARYGAVFAAGRPRPVHVEIPLDLIVASADGLALPDKPPAIGFAAARAGAWCNAATGFGALGCGLPAAIGAALGRPGQPVICLAGDGGLQLTLAELGSAAEGLGAALRAAAARPGPGLIAYRDRRRATLPGKRVHRYQQGPPHGSRP